MNDYGRNTDDSAVGTQGKVFFMKYGFDTFYIFPGHHMKFLLWALFAKTFVSSLVAYVQGLLYLK